MNTARSILDKVNLIRAKMGEHPIPEAGKAIDKKDKSTLSMFDMLGSGPAAAPAGDPSRGGKLHEETRTDSTGRSEKRWIAGPEASGPAEAKPIARPDPNYRPKPMQRPAASPLAAAIQKHNTAQVAHQDLEQKHQRLAGQAAERGDDRAMDAHAAAVREHAAAASAHGRAASLAHGAESSDGSLRDRATASRNTAEKLSALAHKTSAKADATPEANDRTTSRAEAKPPPPAGSAAKTFPVSAAVASHLDEVAEQHADPEGFGVEPDEHEVHGHLLAHYDGKGKLRAPQDPDVADKMAGYLSDQANAADEQHQAKEGEGAHAEGRAHLRAARSAMGALAGKLRDHANELRERNAPEPAQQPPAAGGQGSPDHWGHMLAARHTRIADDHREAMQAAGGPGTPEGHHHMLAQRAHRAAADVAKAAATGNGSEDAAKMATAKADAASKKTGEEVAKLKSAAHPSAKTAAEHEAKAQEHRAAADKAGHGSSEGSQHLYAAYLHKQSAHLHRQVAAGTLDEASAKAASLGAHEASAVAAQETAPKLTHQEAQAKAKEHEQKGQHYGTVNGGWGASTHHAKAAQAWGQAARMLRENHPISPDDKGNYLAHAQSLSDRAAKEEAETPSRVKAREAAGVHDHLAEQHKRAADGATKTGERAAHLDAAKAHAQAAKDARGYSNSTFDPNEIHSRKDYESSAEAAMKQSEHANKLSGAKPSQAAAAQKTPETASFDVQKNTGRETVSGHRVGNFGVHDEAPQHGGLATVTHIPTGLRVAGDFSPEDGLAFAKHLHEKAGDAHGSAEFGTQLAQDHPDSKRLIDAIQSATVKPKPADVAKEIRNSAADHRARQDAAGTYAERAETHRTKANEATDARVREAHIKAADAHDKAAADLRKFHGNWSSSHDAGKARRAAEDAERQAHRDATAKPPEPKPAAEAKPAKVEPAVRAMEALRKILPHRDAAPEDRFRDRWHTPRKGHMHATSIENHPEMQKAKVSPRHIAEAVKRLRMRGEVEEMNTSAAGGGYSVRRTGEGGEDPAVARRRAEEAFDRARSL